MGGMQKSVQTQMLAALIRFLLQFFPKIRLCTTNNCREPSALNLQNPGSQHIISRKKLTSPSHPKAKSKVSGITGIC